MSTEESRPELTRAEHYAEAENYLNLAADGQTYYSETRTIFAILGVGHALLASFSRPHTVSETPSYGSPAPTGAPIRLQDGPMLDSLMRDTHRVQDRPRSQARGDGWEPWFPREEGTVDQVAAEHVMYCAGVSADGTELWACTRCAASGERRWVTRGERFQAGIERNPPGVIHTIPLVHLHGVTVP